MQRRSNARRFARALREELARLPSQIARDVAVKIGNEVQRNFDRGVDPYGRPWRKLAKSTIERGRHAPPLTDTGEGRDSISVEPASGAGIKILVGLTRMLYHQFGGKSHLSGGRRNRAFGTGADLSRGRERPPKRSFLPFDRIPARWVELYQDSLDALSAQAQRRLGK